MLTLRDLARELDVPVRSGEEQLDVPVRWVHISELEDPTPWLSGGELLLTTGLGLSTDEGQRAFVEAVADHGLAGLGFGVGFAHERVPDAMLEAARERGFPILEIPYELPFIAVTEKAFTRLVNEQYAVLQRSIAAQERLQRIVLSERGLDAIVAAIAALVGGTTFVFDGRGELQSSHTFRRAIEEPVRRQIGQELADRARRGERRVFVPSDPDLGPRALALPILAADTSERGGVPQAWLVAVKDTGGLSELDRLVLHQAVTVVALELLRHRVADTTERRLAGDVLKALVAGETDGAELTRRLQPFGLGGEVTALVVQTTAPGGTSVAACEAAVSAALRDEAVSGLVARADRLVVALMPGAEDEELFDLAQRIVARVTAQSASPPNAGVGRAVAAGLAREAYHEARCAMEARLLGGELPASAPAVATYRDLGSFQLLLSLQDSDALRLYCDSLLSPIEQGEGHYGGELMRSLEAFIECNGQWEAAARRLYCHRHTLRYRIRKIEELTGRDLGSARDRIEFWLALRGREIAVRRPTRADPAAPALAAVAPFEDAAAAGGRRA
ncbi:PucR family transcriptional regulator ligand-binding domain-containing protein [Paraconexibacter antarcticus]|uniref:PucR family transcriptional regulator ligand-binding domain-containing protein n=1 Tax=Paraconexibacter antarcticus TaxID=2949664 RepID=A0ABY5DX66_9ACTN|nr:PucR family transcriptional regulator [Paraconexibacter antarcticus]UTI65534.1 PucR family transcriptional regulator ligand-binding domain-containing protein [Paraconexibacter antarcticus]